MLNKSTRILAFIVLMLGFLTISNGLKAQQGVVRKGNQFVVSDSAATGSGTYKKTEYTFTDKKGNVDTIYLSKNGSAFIFKRSKAGKLYRKYLPEVTKQLGTKKEK